jgi:hypothetical protein
MTYAIWAGTLAALGLIVFWVSQWPTWRYRGREYEADHGRSAESLLSRSLGGVGWSQAKVPNRLHQCWIQTQYFSRTSTQMGRCACGGFTQNAGQTWTGRNFRRKRGAHRR